MQYDQLTKMLIDHRLSMFKASEHKLVFTHNNKIFDFFLCGGKIYNPRVIRIHKDNSDHEVNKDDWTDCVMQ